MVTLRPTLLLDPHFIGGKIKRQRTKSLAQNSRVCEWQIVVV